MRIVNISNHPYLKWDVAQLQGADIIIDVPFPNVDPRSTDFLIQRLAESIIQKVKESAPPFTGWEDSYEKTVALVQGEPRLCIYIVKGLQRLGYRTVVATTERNTVDNADGTKTVTFGFVQFADWPYLADMRDPDDYSFTAFSGSREECDKMAKEMKLRGFECRVSVGTVDRKGTGTRGMFGNGARVEAANYFNCVCYFKPQSVTA